MGLQSAFITGIERKLNKLRNADDLDTLSFFHGAATGYIDGVFASHESIMAEEWDRMARLADNAWRNRLRELRAMEAAQ